MLRDTISRGRFRRSSSGIWLGYDSGRSKWLSVYRETIYFSVNHRNTNAGRWLTFENVPSNLGGYSALRNATITSMKLQSSTDTTASVKVYSELVDIQTIELSSEAVKTVSGLDIDIDENERVQVKIESGKIDYPVLMVEMAWRE